MNRNRIDSPSIYPAYPIPWKVVLGISWSIFTNSKRSFHTDASHCISLIRNDLWVSGVGNIPSRGPCLICMNHYSRPGFGAWWIALAISALLPVDIHWIMTAAWTFNDRTIMKPIVPFTQKILNNLAKSYGFTAMPAMPPKEREIYARANAVLSVLKYASKVSTPIIGLAPEGMDSNHGVVNRPPKGVGRFIQKLYVYCKRIIPVGVYEHDGYFCLAFGPPLFLSDLNGVDNRKIDTVISDLVMMQIAQLLPYSLRGVYADQAQIQL